jgi:hypothetical protein
MAKRKQEYTLIGVRPGDDGLEVRFVEKNSGDSKVVIVRGLQDVYEGDSDSDERLAGELEEKALEAVRDIWEAWENWNERLIDEALYRQREERRRASKT